MPRIPHGKVITTDDVENARRAVADVDAGPFTFAVAAPSDLQDFDYLFPTLQDDPDALLPESADTVASLKRLGSTMADDGQLGQDANSPVPAAYTYFGQFVDHDVTLEVASGPVSEGVGGLLAPDMVPLSLPEVRTSIRNARTATLDLDSVYGPPARRHPTTPDRMLVGTVSDLGGQDPPLARPAGKGLDNDVPREPPSTDITHDRAALIGDPRNDENTIVSQLHVAFLKAHNRLVDEGHDFAHARRILRQHYQHVVLHDFLRRVADPVVVDDVLAHGNRWYDPLAEPFFLPLEFSVAAYRFGHTMVRSGYDFNSNFNTAADAPGGVATLELLFTFTALSGQLGFGTADDTLPENWIIEWERLIGDGAGPGGHARRFDTRLAAVVNGNRQALFNLQTVDGQPEQGLAGRLAVRNLLRGYRLRMPTGQAVARLLGRPVLTEAELRAAVGERQADELEAGGFLDRTPLWFYVLAEAAAGGGAHLGPVGSTIVAEVLVGLVRRSDDSILRSPGWTVSLPSQQAGRFELADLLRFAGVLPGGAPTRIHVVVAGETLSGIAQAELGDASRWPEIFAANRAVVRRFDRISPGMVLTLPTGPAPVPQLRFYLVTAGDTLSGIAQKQLGDAARWPEIFALNGDVLSNPDVLVVGQVLQLPGL
jgi:LysM repeat protein